MAMTGAPLPDPLYYLRNFREAIDWVAARHHDLLSIPERQFASQFFSLPTPAQALLARLSMRRGVLFRRSKIRYPEIEPLQEGFEALSGIGWLDARPMLTLQEVFELTTRAELAQRFGALVKRTTKQAACEALIDEHLEARAFEDWLHTDEPVYHVLIAPMVLQFRLLHFGNWHQEWHEYTLSHLQIFRYEPVPLDERSRAFQSREDIEFFYALYRCHEAVGEGAELNEVLTLLPNAAASQGWLRRRCDRLRYHLGQQAEREEAFETALQMYRDNTEADARVRHVRVLERLERDEEALDAARELLNQGACELVIQRVSRIVARLERRRGCVRAKPERAPISWRSNHLQLIHDPDRRVEVLVQEHLSNADSHVFHLENRLVCSLFGLLCWEALFHPVPGAFFHPFQRGPADLGCPDFVFRRRAVFDACLEQLATGDYVTKILTTFAQKYGTSAPFVHWQAFDEATLELALSCIPAGHLKLYFSRLLDDLTENATGFPDLVQFAPACRTYRLIEVKGPGDRLQDNQKRWLHYCARHDLPAEVWQVSWA